MNAITTIALIFLVVGFLSCSFKDYKTQEEDYSTVEPTFVSLQAKVFTQKCASCHTGANAPHGILCNSYEHMMSHAMFPPLVVPGNPEASSLYKVIRDGTMPKDSRPLPKHVADAIYDWIKNGAKEFENQPVPTPTPPPSEPGCDPGEPGCDTEPCDVHTFPNEPGIIICT